MIIYVLKLEDNKYYVGRCSSQNNFNYRLRQHINGSGSYFTRKFKPVENPVVEKLYLPDNNEMKLLEDMKTKEYMIRFGVDNVRGGSYCKINLDKEEKRMLCRELYGASGACFRCGKMGHWVKHCKKKEEKNSEFGEDLKEVFQVASFTLKKIKSWFRS